MSESAVVVISPERRASLAAKGRLLYGKYCGTDGRGICAESFAVFHIGRGEAAVAEDLLAFLEGRREQLEADDPDGRLAMTRGLIERVRGHLAEVGCRPPLTGPELRRFVKGE